MENQKELNARIEQIDQNLKFYSLFWDDLLTKGVSKEELFRRLNSLLDKRLEVSEELKG